LRDKSWSTSARNPKTNGSLVEDLTIGIFDLNEYEKKLIFLIKKIIIFIFSISAIFGFKVCGDLTIEFGDLTIESRASS